MSDTFREITGRSIRWTDSAGVVHACEGADVHPGIRLIWTLCERDVPAGKSYLPGDGDAPVNCQRCAASQSTHTPEAQS